MTTKDNWDRVSDVLSAAFALPAEQRGAYVAEACGDDDTLRAEVAELLAEDLEATQEKFLEPVGLIEVGDEQTPDKYIGRDVGPYRIEKLIGKGGMARVYLAQRRDYPQSVAIKLMRGGIDPDEVARRFRSEVNTQAQASKHENIASLIDAGVIDDDQLYLVMEYVDGAPVDQFCNEQRRNVRERLQLFRQICGAVAFAHGELIIHRDLKPSNILVTKEGVPKLVDFGIAKHLESDEATQTSFRAFTPEYASPEQIVGETLSTATDIYSLGVLLYQLLTGTKPHNLKGMSRTKAERTVCEVDPTRPSDRVVASKEDTSRMRTTTSSLRRMLLGDLDVIVLKALERERRGRYASVEALIADIAAYLDGQPVTASRRTALYVVRKFVRRQRLAISIAGLLLVMIIGFAGAFAAMRVAHAERANARRSLELSFDSLRVAFREISEEQLFNEPRLQPLRERLLRDLLAHATESVQHLVGDARNQDLIVAERAFAHHGLGALAVTANDFDLALVELGQAAQLKEELLRENPDDPELARDVGITYGMIGRVFRGQKELDAARAEFKKARDLLEVAVRQSQSPEATSALAKLYSQLGLTERDDRKLEQARVMFEKEYLLARKLAEQHPDNIEYVLDLGINRINYGTTTGESGDLNAATIAFAEARNPFENILAANPDHPGALQRLATVLHNLGESKRARGEYREAEQFIEEELAITQRLLDLSPWNDPTRADLTSGLTSYGYLKADLKEFDQAIAQLERAKRTWRAAIDRSLAGAGDDPLSGNVNLRYVFEYATACRRLGEVYQEALKPDRALEEFAEGTKYIKHVIEMQPGVPQFEIEVARLETGVARIYLTQDQSQSAEAPLASARKAYETLIEARPGDFVYVVGLVDVVELQATAKELNDDASGAISDLLHAVTKLSPTWELAKQHVEIEQRFSRLLRRLTGLYRDQKKFEDAVKMLTKWQELSVSHARLLVPIAEQAAMCHEQSEEGDVKQQLHAMTIDLLKNALKAGETDIEALLEAKAFASLHDDIRQLDTSP